MQLGDQAMRDHGSGLPVPTFDEIAFTEPPQLDESTVAIVTSAALHGDDDRSFSVGDASYRVIGAVVHDIRTYYEEAALSLVDTGDLDGRALEAWFYESTEAGKLLLESHRTIQAQDAPAPVWFYMAPAHR